MALKNMLIIFVYIENLKLYIKDSIKAIFCRHLSPFSSIMYK
jgi:hypothetical protein